MKDKSIEIDECMAILSEMIRSPLTARREKIAALDRLAKLRGWYTAHKTQDVVEGQGVLNFENWSDDELKQFVGVKATSNDG